jgi:hypothetical protein
VDSAVIGGLVAVGAVILLALAARGMQKKSDPGTTPPRVSPEGWTADRNVPPGAAAFESDDDDDDDEDGDDDGDEQGGESGHIIAVTADGEAFVPHRHAVRLIPPEEQGEAWKVGAGIKSSNLRGEQALAMSWHAGDFTGARVVHGSADEPPWRLEALGRDGEYTHYGFETREGAEAARKLFEQLGVVQLGEDEDGRLMPPSAEQFEEARRIYKETEAALEMPDDEEPRSS